MSWRGIEGGLAAAKENHDVIMTPGTHCYFDHYQSESPDEPLAIGVTLRLKKYTDGIPVPQDLEKEKHRYILGGQANLWSEYIKTYSGVEYMVYPRGMAMSEALWTQADDYSDFLKRFVKHNVYWKSNGVNIANHIYDLKPKIKAGNAKPVSVSFSLPGNAGIKQSIDGVETKMVTSGEDIVISQSGKHTFQRLMVMKRGNHSILILIFTLATKAILTMAEEPAKQYYGNGPGSIINGVTGSNEKYGGTEWLGFDGKNCTGFLDFGKKVEVGEIQFRFLKVKVSGFICQKR
jgi:hexosaminidase